MPFTRQTPPFVDKSVDPNGPSIDAAWHNKVDKGTGDAHDELANHDHDSRYPAGDPSLPTDGYVWTYDQASGGWLPKALPAASSVSGHEIQEDGAALAQRAALDFQGPDFELSDDAAGGKTVVQIGNTYVDVRKYGAVGDGVTDDSSAFNSALQYLDGKGGGILHVPPREYLAPNIVLPGAVTTPQKILGIVGYGATLKSNAGSPIISRPLPLSISEQGGFLNYRFLIEGLRFEGDGVTAGQKALFIPCTYGSQIVNCVSRLMDVGFDLVFALMARVEGCFESGSRSRGFVARSAAGLYTGATVNSSGSNQTVLRNSRSYGTAGMEAQFYVSASSGVQMEGCVTEGFNPVDSVVYDYAGSSSKLFTVRNHHAENTPTNSVFRIISGGRTYLEKVYRGDLPATNLVDVTGSLTVSAIHLVNWPWVSANGKFKHDSSTNPVWRTDELGTALPKDLFNPVFWDGGVVPPTLRVQDNRGLKSVSISSGALPLPAAQANYVGISATGTFSVGTPTQVNRGLTLTLDIKNDSAGTIAIGWAAVFLKAGDFVPPAAGKRKIISFYYDGSNWIETYRSATDIA